MTVEKLLAAFFAFAGTMHFVRPREYGDHAALRSGAPRGGRVSGAAELAGGLAVIPAATAASPAGG